MSLPETIWWCVPHNTCGSSYGCQFGREDDCRMVEVELHPVGSRVAGPDDLVIRRDEATVERIAISLWLNEGPKDAGETWNNQDDITRGFYRSMAGEALAAAEGGTDEAS